MQQFKFFDTYMNNKTVSNKLAKVVDLSVSNRLILIPLIFKSHTSASLASAGRAQISSIVPALSMVTLWKSNL